MLINFNTIDLLKSCKFNRYGVFVRWGILMLMVLGGAIPGMSRDILSLDGEWRFQLDPQRCGETHRWDDNNMTFVDTIQVPGCWDAQGFGEETDKVYHNYIGLAWYKRVVEIPRQWYGKRLFLCIGGVHRYAKVWINGKYLGEKIGPMTEFECEATNAVDTGQPATVVIAVDSKQRWEIDTLAGTVDIIDNMYVAWGGIWGHVKLEARGDMWLSDLFVRPQLSPDRCTVTAGTHGIALSDTVRLDVLDARGRLAFYKIYSMKEVIDFQGKINIQTDIPDAKYWTPDTPYLYTARVTLLSDGREVDAMATRFGMREIEIQGYQFLLNGKRIFLRGYGDDSIYPETMAPPSDTGFYRKRLKLIKQYGFNHVRHHSHFLPPEYYDACDEMGMLVSAEFPIAYQFYYDRATPEAKALYKSEWDGAIRRYRNHPSIFDWSMGNESIFIDITPELYRAAKELDPTRPVIDTDGLWGEGWLNGTADRETLDFFSLTFAINDIPLDIPDKFASRGTSVKPVISHETGNYGTFPRPDLEAQFKHNFKPFWLAPAREKLQRKGLWDEADRWAENSEKLYFLCHKLNIEALRKNEKLSGHHWWLFQEYWTGTNGIVDTYFRPKHIDTNAVRAFVNDIVVLQDGLDITYSSGEKLDLNLLVSNFSPDSLSNFELRWTIEAGSNHLNRSNRRIERIEQGRVETVARISLPLPEVEEPTRMAIAVELKTGRRRVENSWDAWLYPSRVEQPEMSVPLYVADECRAVCGDFQYQKIPMEGALPERAVYVTRNADRRMLDAMVNGAVIILLSPQEIFPSKVNRFKTNWWVGSESDSYVGTVVYKNPITQAMAPEGWCDRGWYHLVEQSQAFVLDEFPQKPEVFIRSIDNHLYARDKALLFAASVGRGTLLVSGLKHTLDGEKINKNPRPEEKWLVARMVEYAAEFPRPKAELPESYLQRIFPEAVPVLHGPFVQGFARLLKHDAEDYSAYPDYRGEESPMVLCRQDGIGHVVEWETQPVPERALKNKKVTFVFAGALGYRSQPKKNGFILQVNGRAVLRFDIAHSKRFWSGENGDVFLFYLPRNHHSMEDDMGLFCVQVQTSLLTAGKPCRLGVVSDSEGSRRWFGLHHYTDIIPDGVADEMP